MKNRIPKWLKVLVSIVFWIGIWTLISSIIDKELLVPAPTVVAQRLCALITETSFWVKSGISLARIVAGFAIGCVAGVLLAVLSFVSELAEAVIMPFIRVVRATPVMSFIMLVMLFVGYNFVPVYIAGLLVTPIMYMNVLNGIRQVDNKLIEVADIFDFSRVKRLKLLYVPAVEPFFASGAVTSLGLAWKSGIAAEVLCQLKLSIGGEMYFSKLYLETPDLFAWTIVIILLSLVLEKAFNKLVDVRLSKKRRNGEQMSVNPMTVKGQPTEMIPVERQPAGETPEKRSMREQCSSAIEIEGVSVSFGNQKVLENLTLNIGGGITCIMGESGSGKTTLLRTIAGLLSYDSGEIRKHPERVAFMFQEDRLLPWLTAVENIAAVCDDESKSRSLLEQLELTGHEDKLPAELSGGMQRRIALARAIAFEGDILILDEPFKGLDAALAERVSAFLRTLTIPIIIATHDESDISRLNASKITLLKTAKSTSG